MRHIRAYVDRDATTSEGPIRFIAATEGRKGDGIDLRMSGVRLDRYRANPVFLWGHNYRSLPIGRGIPVVDGDRLLMDVEFDQDDDFARQVERKYRKGLLNAVSIGFDVDEWEGDGDYWRGGVATSWTLLELSGVSVPMDPDAVVESGRDHEGVVRVAVMDESRLRDVIRDELAKLHPAVVLDATEQTPPAGEREVPEGEPALDTAALAEIRDLLTINPQEVRA